MARLVRTLRVRRGTPCRERRRSDLGSLGRLRRAWSVRCAVRRGAPRLKARTLDAIPFALIMSMDITSAFRTEIFRPLMILVAPGATAIAPYALILRHEAPVISGFLERHSLVGFAVLSIATMAAGFVLEDLGSRLGIWWDDRLKRRDPEFGPTWDKYLTLAFSPEPVGQRYIRGLLLRMKFETHFALALLISLAGWLWLESIHTHWTFVGLVLFVIGHVILSAYLLFEAHSAVPVLHNVRAQLVNRFYSERAQ